MNYYNFFKLHFNELTFLVLCLIFNFLYIFFICFLYSNQLIFLFLIVLIKLDLLKYLIFTHITEIFVTKINICFFVSFFLTLNIFIIKIWFFLYEGLYKHENIKFFKKYLLFLLFSIISLKLIFKHIIPNIWYFFLKNNLLDHFNLFFEPKFNEYFNFYLYSFMLIYFIFIYIFILYLSIFSKINKTKILFFLKYRKYFYFKFFLISIFISLPELLSQILIFFYFLILFELLLFISLLKLKYKGIKKN